MSMLHEQFDQYMQILRNGEEFFIKEISGYNMENTLVKLKQIKDVFWIIKQNRDPIVANLKKIQTSITINTSKLKDNKLLDVDTLENIRVLNSDLSVQLSSLMIMENDYVMLLKYREILLNKINE